MNESSTVSYTENSTESSFKEEPSGASIAASLIYFLPAVLFNMIAIQFIVRDVYQIKTPTNILLLGKCCIDFIAATYTFVWHTIVGYMPIMTYGICAFKANTNPISPLYNSIISALLATDRYLSISHPFFYKKKISRDLWIILLVIFGMFSVFVCSLPLMDLGEFWYVDVSNEMPASLCSTIRYNPDPKKQVFIFSFLFVQLASSGSIVFCNGKVIFTALKLHKRINAFTPTVTDEMQVQNDSKKTHEMEFAKLVIALTAVYLVCWTPYHVSVLCTAFDITLTDALIGISHLLAGLSYSVDPIIYILMRKRYRQQIIRRLKSCCLCQD